MTSQLQRIAPFVRILGVGGGIVALQGHTLPLLVVWLCITCLVIDAVYLFREVWKP